MRERPNRTVSKTVVPSGTVGSNPTPSAEPHDRGRSRIPESGHNHTGLENRCAFGHRGFKSHSLRQKLATLRAGAGVRPAVGALEAASPAAGAGAPLGPLRRRATP